MTFPPIRFFYRPWRVVTFWPMTMALAFLLLIGSFSLSAASSKAPVKEPISTLNDPQLIAPEIRRIQERGNLIVAILDHEHIHNCHPFVIDDGKGNLSGLNIDLLEGFAENLDITLSYNNSAKSFDELIELVARGQADIATCGVSRTIHRSLYVNFTNPYFELHQGLLINRLKLSKQADGHSWHEIIKGLRGQLGVLSGSSYARFARKHLQGMELVFFPHLQEIHEAVTSGSITAAYLDEFNIKQLIRNRPDQVLLCQTVIFKDLPDRLAIPVSRQNPQLLKLLNIYIDNHPIDLTIDQILDRYLPTIESK